jgi:MFS family permease
MKSFAISYEPPLWQEILTFSRGLRPHEPGELDVDLKEDEREALRNEKDKLFNERGITMVNLAVSLAAMLQGHVQSSINGASLYAAQLGIEDTGMNQPNWTLGAVNAAPFFTAAALGCWLALPINNYLGRRGGMIVSAVLIFFTSLVAGLTVLIREEDRWKLLLGARVLNGIGKSKVLESAFHESCLQWPRSLTYDHLELGMGIKAVSTPILASETAIRFWRGSFVLAWQLWCAHIPLRYVSTLFRILTLTRVSFGIMIGFVFNLIFAAIVNRVYGEKNRELTVALILGAPLIFAIAMLGAVLRCTESPRYYMRGGQASQKYKPKKAYEMLQKLRSCKVSALH